MALLPVGRKAAADIEGCLNHYRCSRGTLTQPLTPPQADLRQLGRGYYLYIIWKGMAAGLARAGRLPPQVGQGAGGRAAARPALRAARKSWLHCLLGRRTILPLLPSRAEQEGGEETPGGAPCLMGRKDLETATGCRRKGRAGDETGGRKPHGWLNLQGFSSCLLPGTTFLFSCSRRYI